MHFLSVSLCHVRGACSGRTWSERSGTPNPTTHNPQPTHRRPRNKFFTPEHVTAVIWVHQLLLVDHMQPYQEFAVRMVALCHGRCVRMYMCHALSCSRVFLLLWRKLHARCIHKQVSAAGDVKSTPRGHRGQEGNKTRTALRILNVLWYALSIAVAIDEIVLGVVLFVQRFLCFHACECAVTHTCAVRGR